mgnify:CR=1 FL=1
MGQTGGRVSVVLVTWNSATYLQELLPALALQSYPDWELICVDNGSADESVARVLAAFPQAALVRNRENVGFCRANNQGIRRATGAYVLLLNADAIPEPDYLTTLVDFLIATPDCAGVTGKLLWAESRNCSPPRIDSAGHCLNRLRQVFDRGAGQPDRGQYDRTEPVFSFSAAAALYRRQCLLDIALPGAQVLDEAFFAYSEDVDLNWRCWHWGWSCWYVPTAVAWHYRGHARTKPLQIRRAAYGNRYRLLLRNECWWALAPDLPLVLLYEICRLLRTLFTDPGLLTAYGSVLADLRRLLATRPVGKCVPDRRRWR